MIDKVDGVLDFHEAGRSTLSTTDYQKNMTARAREVGYWRN